MKNEEVRRLEAEGEMSNAKCQSSNDKVQTANGDELVGCIGLIGFIG